MESAAADAQVHAQSRVSSQGEGIQDGDGWTERCMDEWMDLFFFSLFLAR